MSFQKDKKANLKVSAERSNSDKRANKLMEEKKYKADKPPKNTKQGAKSNPR